MTVFALEAYATGTGTVSTAALDLANATFGFSAAELADAQRVILQPFSADVRFRQTGGSATADTNSSFGAQAVLLTINHNRTINDLSFIRAAGTNVDLKATLYR